MGGGEGEDINRSCAITAVVVEEAGGRPGAARSGSVRSTAAAK